MTKILFICHGNICRSTMAESMLAHEIVSRGLEAQLSVDSAATHTDALGCPPHHGTVEKLRREGIPVKPHRARLLTREDGKNFDLILGMDEENRRMAQKILGPYAAKFRLLLDFCDRPRPVADPWYTGDFDRTYEDLREGVDCLLAALLRQDRESSK